MARFIQPAGSGGGSASANIADFIFINEDEGDSKMTLPINKELTIETTRDEEGDTDINIESADDVFIRAYGDDIGLSAFNEVNISTDDGNYTWSFTNSGNFDLPGYGYISNPSNSSGDPDTPNVDTLHLVPDENLDNDRYIILDPTSPNHIHIRAGGVMDDSSAQLILGGEKAHVSVTDNSHDVGISTYDAEGDNYYGWNFGNDGVFNGPAGGLVTVYGLNGVTDSELLVSSLDNAIVLSASNGEFLNDAEIPSNQIATLGDIGVETEYAVQGGTDGNQPTFTGDPLFSASYIKMSSNLVHFQIQVDMDNITNFGTGQYYMTLPFNSKYGYKFRDGCLHDQNTGITYHISAHVFAGSNQITLFTSDTQGNTLYDFPFTSTEPITLATADNFHIAGTYICE